MERCTLRPAPAQRAPSTPRRGLAFAHMLRITTLLMHTCTTYETERTSSWQNGVLAKSRHGKLSSHPHAVMTLLHVARPSPDPPLSSPTSASTTIPTLAECRPGKMLSWQNVALAESRNRLQVVTSHSPVARLPPSPLSSPPATTLATIFTTTDCRPDKKSSWQKVVLAKSHPGRLSSRPQVVTPRLPAARPPHSSLPSPPANTLATISTTAECRPGQMSSWQKVVMAKSRPSRKSHKLQVVAPHSPIARPTPSPLPSSPATTLATIPPTAECHRDQMSSWQKAVMATCRHTH